jgi:hypothetical protein
MWRFTAVICVAAICGSGAAATPAFDAGLAQRLGADEQGSPSMAW